MRLGHRLSRAERQIGLDDMADVSDSEVAFNDQEAWRLRMEAGRTIIHQIYQSSADNWNDFYRLDDARQAVVFLWMIQNDAQCQEAWERYESRIKACRADPALMARLRRNRADRRNR